MKRIFTAIAILGCMAMMAHAAGSNEVTSVNVVGYNKTYVPPSGNFNLISVQFDAFEETLLGVFGTNQLTQGVAPPLADRLYIYDPSGPGYNVYFQKPDDQFYVAGGSTPTNPPLVAGTGLWVKSPNGNPNTNEIVIAGEVVDVATQSVDVVAGYQLMAYPYSSDIPLNSTDIANDGATQHVAPGAADRIFVWNGGGYDIYALKGPPGGSGGDWHSTSDWSGAPTTDELPLGVGFWYQAKKAFNWTEPIPYADALD